MTTDPSLADRRSAPRPDDPTSELVAQLHDYSRAVIDAELRRLARRAPSLRPNDLDAIEAALEELVESLLLARLRSLPEHTAQLKHLFGNPREDSCRGIAARRSSPGHRTRIGWRAGRDAVSG